jgi:hypothetical protein
MTYTDEDIVDYGKLRSSGISREEAHEKIMMSKKIKSLIKE